MSAISTNKCQSLIERWLIEEKILRDIVAARVKKLQFDISKPRPNIKDCERQLREIKNLNDYIMSHIRASRIELDKALDSMTLIMEASGIIEDKVNNVQEW